MEEAEQVKNYCGVSFCTTEQNMESKLSKVTRDNNDCKKFEDWFIFLNPFPFLWHVSLISTGVVMDKKNKVSSVRPIWTFKLGKHDGNNFGQVKFSPINRDVPMRGFTINVKVHENLVVIDPRINWTPAIFWSLFPGPIRSKRLVLCIDAGGVVIFYRTPKCDFRYFFSVYYLLWTNFLFCLVTLNTLILVALLSDFGLEDSVELSLHRK
ncbi:hypothetical protein AVEN_137068-1 [Araneus ventricosus]|uniref:Uncharacterized protein n=1 Tax=Araneus ventricosus TaxID=182803 RepID=A0A4Y2DU91_ARAVE|nr:hypothetical protein AVEN_137068-1 [Araneus ventricosus]